MHEKLPVHLIRQLTENLKRLRQAGSSLFGSLCSGTDICMKVVEELMDYWSQQYDITVEYSQAFATEIDNDKAEWLLGQIANQDGEPCLFHDNQDMKQTHARCRVHEDAVPGGCLVKHCRVTAAGFTCKSRSSLNARASHNRGCVQRATDTTGESWAAVYAYVCKHHPDAFIAENVMGLNADVPGSDETDAEFIVRKLKEAGYGTVEMLELDATRFGSRALRRRLYWLALLGEDRGRGAMIRQIIKAVEVEALTRVKYSPTTSCQPPQGNPQTKPFPFPTSLCLEAPV